MNPSEDKQFEYAKILMGKMQEALLNFMEDNPYVEIDTTLSALSNIFCKSLCAVCKVREMSLNDTLEVAIDAINTNINIYYETISKDPHIQEKIRRRE